MAFSTFLAVSLACAGAALSIVLADNQWATDHRWLIPKLWWAASISLLLAIVCTKWCRALFTSHKGKAHGDMTLNAKGRPSSVGAVGAIGKIGANSKVYIGAVGAASEDKNSLTRREKEKPSLAIIGGVRAIECEIPMDYDQNARDFTHAFLHCHTIAIRNNAETSLGEADGIVAHLDFESDTRDSIHVHEGWWKEDSVQQNIHHIGRGETKHLVILLANRDTGELATLPKEWKERAARYLPGEPELLAPSAPGG